MITQPCNTQACPVDCVVGEWSDWSCCSVVCGGGSQTSTRAILTPAANGGADCPVTVQTQTCNTYAISISMPLADLLASALCSQACPVNCVESAWSEWSTCSAYCGGGVQYANATILVEGANGATSEVRLGTYRLHAQAALLAARLKSRSLAIPNLALSTAFSPSGATGLPAPSLAAAVSNTLPTRSRPSARTVNGPLCGACTQLLCSRFRWHALRPDCDLSGLQHSAVPGQLRVLCLVRVVDLHRRVRRRHAIFDADHHAASGLWRHSLPGHNPNPALQHVRSALDSSSLLTFGFVSQSAMPSRLRPVCLERLVCLLCDLRRRCSVCDQHD